MHTHTIYIAAVLSSAVLAWASPGAEQKTLEDAMALSTALNVPLSSTSQIRTAPFFPDGITTISTNDLQFIKQTPLYPNQTDFNVSSNSIIVAYGTFYERASYDNARTSLMLELVNNNMMVEVIALGYKKQTNHVGDFSIIGTTLDDITNETIDGPSKIHFVRGAKAVSLFGKDGADVRPIAEVLDELLKLQSASQP